MHTYTYAFIHKYTEWQLKVHLSHSGKSNSRASLYTVVCHNILHASLFIAHLSWHQSPGQGMFRSKTIFC